MFPRFRILTLFLTSLVTACLLTAIPVHAQEETPAAKEATKSLATRTSLLRPSDYVPAIEQAKGELRGSYERLLHRRQFGFDRGLNDHVRADVSAVRAEFEAADAAGRVSMLLPPILALVLFLLLLALIDRAGARLTHRYHASTDAFTNSWANRTRRAGLVAAGRMAPVALLLPLTYFPVQAVFSRAPWTISLTELAWLLLAYRGLHAGLLGSYAFRLFSVSDATADRLLNFALWSMRVVFLWLAAISIVDAVDYRESFSALLNFLLNSSLVFLAVAMLFLRDEFVELLSHDEDGKDSRFTQLADDYFYPAVIVTIVLLALGAVGYVDAAKFVLVRGYGAVFAIFSSLRAASWVRKRIQLMRSDARSQDEAELYRSIGTMIRGASILIFVGVVLSALHLVGPITTLLSVPLVTIGETAISPMAIFDAVFVVAGAVFLGKALRALMLTRIFPIFGVEIGVGYAINTLINYAVIVIGVLVATAALGIDLSSLTVLMASLGVGIGLGLQNLTENLVSGFILLFGRSVKKGDVVTVNDVYGRVDAVGARSVIIKTPDNFDMLIPSRQLVTGQVINWSYRDTLVRLHLPVGVTYSANPRDVEKILVQAAKKHPRVLDDPAPEVWLVGFGDSSVNFELLVYFDISRITMDRLRGQLNFAVWDALAEANIEIPFPQRDLHIRSGEFFPELKGALDRHARPPEPGEDAEPSEESGTSPTEDTPTAPSEDGD